MVRLRAASVAIDVAAVLRLAPQLLGMDQSVVVLGAAIGVGTAGLGLIALAVGFFLCCRRRTRGMRQARTSCTSSRASKVGGKASRKGGAAPKRGAKTKAKKASTTGAKYARVDAKRGEARDLLHTSAEDWRELDTP